MGVYERFSPESAVLAEVGQNSDVQTTETRETIPGLLATAERARAWKTTRFEKGVDTLVCLFDPRRPAPRIDLLSNGDGTVTVLVDRKMLAVVDCIDISLDDILLVDATKANNLH